MTTTAAAAILEALLMAHDGAIVRRQAAECALIVAETELHEAVDAARDSLAEVENAWDVLDTCRRYGT